MISLPNGSTQTRLIRVGRFAIKHELGRGSIGVVYLAHDPVIDRDVAIKTFRSKLSLVEKKQHEQHFINEARAAGRLAHANIVTIYEASSEGDATYIAMEYLQGRELNKMLDGGHLFNASEVASISWKIADALDHAHRNGVVHRDIKPANIFLSPDLQPKVVDFGIARAPNRVADQLNKSADPYTLFHDNILGTPNYMSPEQAMGLAVDARTDIYSLGAVMYEMLTGRKPFQASDTEKLLHQISFKAAAEPHKVEASVPLALSKIVMKAMSKKADKRYQNAQDMALDIKRFLARARRENGRKAKLEDIETTVESLPIQQSRLFWPICGGLVALAIVAYTFWRS